MEIAILDHIILAHDKITSMRDEGLFDILPTNKFGGF